MLMKQQIKFSWAWCMIVLSSIIAGIILLYDYNKPNYYLYLPLLPFAFALMNILTIRIYENIYKNIGLILIIGLYYCRLVIVPIIMSIGKYSSLEKLNIYQNMPNAILLMIYEILIVYIVIYWSVSKSKYIKNKKTIKIQRSHKPVELKIFGVIIAFVLFFDVAVFIFIPESRYLYTNILSALNKVNYGMVNIDGIIERGNIKRACLTLYTMTMEIIKVFVPAYFIIAIRRKVGERAAGIVLSIPFILLQFIFVSDTLANSIMCAFILMLLVAKLYPLWSSKLYMGSLLIGAIFVFGYFIYESNLPSMLYSNAGMKIRSSELANAYFSGPDNVAAAFNVVNKNKWKTLFYTLISSIPFNGSIFGLKGLNFSALYNLYNRSAYQIAPCISESYFYFGKIMSPLVSAVLANLSIRYGERAQFEKNLWKYVSYEYFSLLLAMSLVMYNGTIFLKTFTCLVLPMMILSGLSSDEGLKTELDMHYDRDKQLQIFYKVSLKV